MSATATKTHSFAVANPAGEIVFVHVEAGATDCEAVVASTIGDLSESTMPLSWARDLYRAAKAEGSLISTESAQQVIDGEAKLVKLTQKGRSFFRVVKGSPFRYAQSCARRSGVKTGYDVCA